MSKPRTSLFLVAFCSAFAPAMGQTDQAPTEFLRSTWPLELAQGFIGPYQAYAGTATLARLFKVVPGKLRIGPEAGALWSDGSVDFIGGARAAWCVKPLGAGEFGTWGNLQLRAEMQWSSAGFFLPGGGVDLEAGERILIGVHGYMTLDPDLDDHPGWLMTSLSFNLDKFFTSKKPVVPVNETIPAIPVIH